MGQSKSSESSGGSTQQTTVQPTAEETELNKILLGQKKETAPLETQAAKSGLTLSDLLLTGGDLPGFLQGLPGGISPDVTQDIVDRSLGDVRAGLQGGGLLDSGVRQELEARTSADIRTQSSQFNLQNLQQLLNLAVGGQAQPFASTLGFGGQLSQSLAGLRGTSTTGNFNQQTTSTNPFLTGKDILGGIGTGIGAFGAFGGFNRGTG